MWMNEERFTIQSILISWIRYNFRFYWSFDSISSRCLIWKTIVFFCSYRKKEQIRFQTKSQFILNFNYQLNFMFIIIIFLISSWTWWLWFSPTFAWICIRIPAGCQSIKRTGKSSYRSSSTAQRNVTGCRWTKLFG